MKAVFLLFNSLNRHMLAPYGGTRIPTPNFARLARRSVAFDKHYCRQPALHAGPARPADRPPQLPPP